MRQLGYCAGRREEILLNYASISQRTACLFMAITKGHHLTFDDLHPPYDPANMQHSSELSLYNVELCPWVFNSVCTARVL